MMDERRVKQSADNYNIIIIIIIINNKIWILFDMSACSFDEPKFTSARDKKKSKKQQAKGKNQNYSA